MSTAKTHLFILLLAWAGLGFAESAPRKLNKLEQMFRFYYLPFTIEFKEGQSPNEIFPFSKDKYQEFNRLVRPEELNRLDREWESLREEGKKRSLFLATPVGLNETIHLSQRLITHRIPLARNAWHGLNLSERIKLESILGSKPEPVQKAVTQLRLVKSFLTGMEEEKFNFFIIGPHWCDSSREYRALLESYFKAFPNSDLILHSVVIEDPKEEIFDSKLLKDLFPNSQAHSHDIVPKFIAIHTVDGQTTIWEEAEALKELYDRFYKGHRGYLDQKVDAMKVISLPGPRGEGRSETLANTATTSY